MPHPALSERVHPSLGRSFEHRVNCFCVSEFFFRETAFRQTTADEMLDFVAQSFHQVSDGPSPILTLVWSRSSFVLPLSEALKPYTGLAGFEITRHQAR